MKSFFQIDYDPPIRLMEFEEIIRNFDYGSNSIGDSVHVRQRVGDHIRHTLLINFSDPHYGRQVILKSFEKLFINVAVKPTSTVDESYVTVYFGHVKSQT